MRKGNRSGNFSTGCRIGPGEENIGNLTNEPNAEGAQRSGWASSVHVQNCTPPLLGKLKDG